MARPIIPEPDQLSERIQFRVAGPHKPALARIAGERGYRTVSEMMRDMAMSLLEGGGQGTGEHPDSVAGIGTPSSVVVVWGPSDVATARHLADQIRRLGGLYNQEVRALNGLVSRADDFGVPLQKVERRIQRADALDTDVEAVLTDVLSFFATLSKRRLSDDGAR